MTPNRSPDVRVSYAACVAALLLVATGLAGCSHKDSGDDAVMGAAGAPTDLLAPRPIVGGLGFPSARARYPLAVGSRWDYRLRGTSQVITDTGPKPPVTVVEALRVEIVGTQRFGDQEYFVQEVSYPQSGSPYSRYAYIREDRSGVFMLPSMEYVGAPDAGAVGPQFAHELGAYVDRTVLDPARRDAFQRAVASIVVKAKAARPPIGGESTKTQGAEPGESTEVRFPLFVGARWFMFEGAEYVRSVVGRERIQVPLGAFSAWKVRETFDLFPPEYRAYLWYGALGWVRERYHAEVAATDTSGRTVGRVLIDTDVALAAVHLEDRAATAGRGSGN
jgi:hypothetical protein